MYVSAPGMTELETITTAEQIVQSWLERFNGALEAGDAGRGRGPVRGDELLA